MQMNQPATTLERIAITGANGFIGTRLTDFLQKQGYPIVTITRKPFACGSTENTPVGQKGFKSLKSSDLKNVTTVIHLAAQAHNPNATKADYYENNLKQTKALMKAIVQAGIKRIIYASSVKAVGEESGTKAFNSQTEPQPKDDYGRSKLATEQLIKDTCQRHNLDYIILRLPLVISPNAKGNLGLITKVLKAGIPLPLKIQHNRRDTLSITNINTAILSCLKRWPERSDTLFLSDGKPRSTADLIHTMASYQNIEAKLFYLPAPLLRTALTMLGKAEWYQRLNGNLEVDIKATMEVLNWSPSLPSKHKETD